MILFARDWARFPNAIVDVKTSNQSFLRIAQLYKSMKIANHAFPLALHQPELQGVDPHSPNLTQEQKALIGLEVRYNPWYYLREVARLPPMAGPVPVPFLANRGNIALFWSFLNNIDAALIQPRQTGKSASTDTLMDWLIYIAANNTRIQMVTKDDALRKANVERLKGIRDLLPPYLVNVSSKDADNQFELTCVALGNRYSTGVAQSSESSANNLGRGLTSPVFQFDEGPFCTHIGVTVPAALAAGTAAREEAAKNNRPYGNIFTTTAGKKDDRDGRYMYDMIHNGAVWNEKLFDCADKKELRQTVLKNGSGRKPFLNITMSHRQLGKTDQWLYEAITASNATGEEADRDFLNIWPSGTQRSPLSVKLNETIRNSEMEVLHTEISPERYVLRWYLEEEEVQERMASGSFAMGLDMSEAVGRDTIALVITDLRDLSVVAAGTYNETNLISFARYILGLLVRYPNVTLVPEMKSQARTVIDYLILKLPSAGQDPFKRIFNKIVDEAREHEDNYRIISSTRLESRNEAFYDQRKIKFGFNTDATNRTLLYTTILQNAAKKAGHLVRDKPLSSEIRGLVEKNGRIDHSSSGNDDMVIAWLLTHWLAMYGRNLNHYGIPLGYVMAGVVEVGKEVKMEDAAVKELQEDYTREVETILDELKESRNEFLTAKLEHRLRHLSTKLSNSGVETSQSIDALIQQAAEERIKQTRLNARQSGPGGNRPISYGFRR